MVLTWQHGLAVTLVPVEMVKARWWWFLPYMPISAYDWFATRRVMPAGTIVRLIAAIKIEAPEFDCYAGPATYQIDGHPWHHELPLWYRQGETSEYRPLTPLEQLAWSGR